MPRIFLGLVFFALYIAWIIYRVIKKDIKQHKAELYLYSFFMVIWALIYYWFFLA